MTSIYAAIVQGGVMNGTFATVTGANPAGNVEAFAAQIKKGSPELADVELRHMTVFGPWESFALVPEDVGGATKGRGLAPIIALSSLIGATGRLLFLGAHHCAPSYGGCGCGGRCVREGC